MPVTKTAKRALRVSTRKRQLNKSTVAGLDASIRIARKSRLVSKVLAAISLTDQAAKKKVIHANKASRIKSSLSKLLPKSKVSKTLKRE
ncbi:30S ribosomal protein S20 [Candidatus Woesebacteria bacterium]|nr:30S ribosomal protein S20 [Candidatus Woesebacteria bacterium]